MLSMDLLLMVLMRLPGRLMFMILKINTKGAYANTLIKDKGKWKIANSVLSPIAKVIITQEVKDFAKFKSNFARGIIHAFVCW